MKRLTTRPSTHWASRYSGDDGRRDAEREMYRDYIIWRSGVAFATFPTPTSTAVFDTIVDWLNQGMREGYFSDEQAQDLEDLAEAISRAFSD